MYIYVMECEGYHKIGMSNTPKARRRNVQSGNPFPVNLVFFGRPREGYARDLEGKLHWDYQEFRHTGEWFLFPDGFAEDVLEEIRKACY